MVATLTLPLFLVLFGNNRYHIKVDQPGVEQASSSVSLKVRPIQQNMDVCSERAPFALSVAVNSDHTQLGFIISLTDEWASGKEYLSVDNDTGLAVFGGQSSATLFVPEIEDLGEAERDGIESCNGFFLSTNSSGQPRILHLTGELNPYLAAYAISNKPTNGSTVVLGLKRICSNEANKDLLDKV